MYMYVDKEQACSIHLMSQHWGIMGRGGGGEVFDNTDHWQVKPLQSPTNTNCFTRSRLSLSFSSTLIHIKGD